jgi:hypothetical protein
MAGDWVEKTGGGRLFRYFWHSRGGRPKRPFIIAASNFNSHQKHFVFRIVLQIVRFSGMSIIAGRCSEIFVSRFRHK